jgi:hypothetical protein
MQIIISAECVKGHLDLIRRRFRPTGWAHDSPATPPRCGRQAGRRRPLRAAAQPAFWPLLRIEQSIHRSPRRKRGKMGSPHRSPSLALFDVALSETEIQEARGASRGNAFRGSNNVSSLSLRFGLRSMYFLTDIFADRRERATSKLALRACMETGLNALFKGQQKGPLPDGERLPAQDRVDLIRRTGNLPTACRSEPDFRESPLRSWLPDHREGHCFSRRAQSSASVARPVYARAALISASLIRLSAQS